MEHLNELKNIFAQYYNWSVYRIDFFGILISAIVRSRSVNMQKVAENIESRAKISSNYRRIQRVFKDQFVDLDMTARLMSTILPNDEKWILTMDRTNWKLGTSNVNLLVLGVAYQGMAIPLLWKFLTKKDKDEQIKDKELIGKRGNSDYQERRELIEKFIHIFGKNRIQALTADREFIGSEWFEWLNKENIPFVIRIRSNITLEQKEWEVKNVKELFSNINHDELYSFGQTILFNQELYLGGIRAIKANEPLILVSNIPINEDTIKTYQKRWEIETMFGALKTKGFNFEESKISGKDKVEKLMAFLSISFLWAFLAGEYRTKEEPIPLKKNFTQHESISNQEHIQAWFRMAQECISKYKNKESGVFIVT